MQHPNHNLPAWVQAAHSIHVRTSLKTLNADLGITDNSTVLDVKQHIDDMEGIPVAQQSLYPLDDSWLNFLSRNTVGPILSDDQRIKNMMNLYNTRHFLLVLRLPSPEKG